ncbi:cyclase family protein [Marinobacterium rhizophilum]|uniref:Cyclase family protein n=1 Tax=Marinobacterium rhizophilum TaxID=420402 RepID=A0ABY5HJK4_9GAMM|nr:cyclase family protein [Marinobacterium rhizophilum]UTW11992.1 cyclase family protein [Marinobacterium rhizophilum]
MTQRWKQRPEGSNWGDFGEDDQIGRLNLLTPERVLAAISEVKEGRSFCLSLPLDYPGGNKLNPRRYPPRRFSTVRDGRANYNYPLSRQGSAFTDVISDDAVLIHTQYSTQWDSLAHVGAQFDADEDGVAETVYYNGWRGGEHVIGPEPGKDCGDHCSQFEGVEASRLGIENMAATAVQGRGVMVDLHAHFGNERVLVGYEDLQRVLDADAVEVEQGDMLCLHTGYTRLLKSMNHSPDLERLNASCAALDGRDSRLLRWIDESGISVLIADNYAVEASPARPGEGLYASLPLHEQCLFKLGIHLGELWDLTELANFLRSHNRSRFLLTAPPLRLPGAVGSPVTPVATV